MGSADQASARPAGVDDRLLDMGLSLSSELSLPVVLRRIVELAVELTGARYGALGVLGLHGRISEFVTVGVTDGERAAIGEPPHGTGILGLLIEQPRPLRLRRIQDDPRSVGFPPNHPSMTSFLGMPIVARGQVFGIIYLTEKQGADEFGEDDQRNLAILAAQAGVAIANARVHEETARREARLEAVREITAAILARTPTDTVLSLIARSARELAEADLATIATPDAAHETMTLAVAEGIHAHELRGLTFPSEGSISGRVMLTGGAVATADATIDPRVAQPVVRLGLVGPAIFVPLIAGSRILGTLMVAKSRERRSFDERDQELVEVFAQQAAVAMEYARAQAELHRLGLMEDRERIAKELHDGVIQALFAVGMGLQGTALLAGDPDIQTRIEGAVEELDRVIHDLRNYIFGLRPGILADRELGEALRQLGREFEEQSGVVTIVEVEGTVAAAMSPLAADLIQLTREALSNVRRHAEAITVRVSLLREGREAVLRVDDDGLGFDVLVGRPGGNGLQNIRDRAGSLGGSAIFHSTLGDGATVEVRLPL